MGNLIFRLITTQNTREPNQYLIFHFFFLHAATVRFVFIHLLVDVRKAYKRPNEIANWYARSAIYDAYSTTKE